MALAIGASPGGLLPLSECAGAPIGRVGRKAALLGWAATANGMATPGGLVLPADRFAEALAVAGAREQVAYLQQAALRLDPNHTLDIAAAVADAMRSPAVDALAQSDAAEAFARVGAPRVVCRSSSAMEDGRRAAFPGVFLSVLDIQSPDLLAVAIADCWRSTFSTDAMRYLLRMQVEPLDLSMAVLVQGQVEASWFGVYVSVDPLTGVATPLADLSDAAADAVVGGQTASVRAYRRDGRWTGLDETPSLVAPLERVHRAAERLAAHVGTEVDVEFALPVDSGEPVILQCRPLTAIEHRSPAVGAHGPSAERRRMVGRSCAGGRAVGLATRSGQATDAGPPTTIAVVERLTTADYGIVFGHAGVVMEHDASALSHVAILCRELGIPLVCGVDGARSTLIGNRVVVDGGLGQVEVLEDDGGSVAAADTRPPDQAVVSAVELLLLLLAEARPGRGVAEEAERVARRCGRALDADAVLVIGHPVAASELAPLEQLGAELFGADFSPMKFLDDCPGSPSGYRNRML